MIYEASKTEGSRRIDVTVRLDDECGNGHQDFAITGDIYEKTKRGWEWTSGGCIHEDIAEVFPELKIFIGLHLADYCGVPLYGVANSFYHLRHGFESIKPDNEGFRKQFCEYYRLTEAQFDVLNGAESQTHYQILMMSLGIREQWQKHADEGIALLESLTGQKFVNTSTRSNWRDLDAAIIEDENRKISEGYYSETSKAERAKAAKEKALAGRLAVLKTERDAKIRAINDVYTIDTQIARICASRNYTVYTHNQTVKFNWKDYEDSIPTGTIDRIKADIVLPDGYTFA